MDIFDASRPLDADGLEQSVRRLAKEYPHIAHCYPIGRSVLGRRLWACVIGNGQPTVLYVGVHHALEYLTGMLLLRFAETLCRSAREGDPFAGIDAEKILRGQAVCIVPMLNPDGVEIHLKGPQAAGPTAGIVAAACRGDTGAWQANAHGVDLNHNYNAGWAALRQMEESSGISGPGPTRYGGPRPESEPETHALCALCRRVAFRRAFALHSQGEEIYWRYGDGTPSVSAGIGRQLARASGYRLADPEGLASNGGFKDWFISAYRRPAFTVEVGLGRNPLPPRDLDGVWEKTREMLLLGMLL